MSWGRLLLERAHQAGDVDVLLAAGPDGFDAGLADGDGRVAVPGAGAVDGAVGRCVDPALQLGLLGLA